MGAITPEAAKAYLHKLVADGRYGEFSGLIGGSGRISPEFMRLFGSTIKDIMLDFMKQKGGFPQLLRAMGAQNQNLLYNIETFKEYLPDLKKLILFNAKDAAPEQLKQIEKLVGRRFHDDFSYNDKRLAKRERRWKDKKTRKNDEPWISGGHEGGMHQPFESRLRKALGLKRLV